MMPAAPSKQKVDGVISQLASDSLIGKPVGSVAMVDNIIGYQKMSFWWNLRVHGVVAAIKYKLRDWRSQ